MSRRRQDQAFSPNIRCCNREDPGLRTISVVIPQARLLDAAQSLATDSYAFVGSAQSEGEIIDGGTGRILAEGVDGRSGGMSVQNAGGGKWADAEHAMDYWVELTAQRPKTRFAGNAMHV